MCSNCSAEIPSRSSRSRIGIDDRRLADDPVPAVDDLAELRERLQAVARASFLRRLPRPLGLVSACASSARASAFAFAFFCFFLEVFFRLARGRSSRSPPSASSRTGARTRRPSSTSPRTRPSPPGRPRTAASVASRASALREAVVARRDREARREALDVVLERARQRLVEVVEVEQQLPLRRGERAEVRQVGVAAQLDLQAGPRGVLRGPPP